MEQQQTPSENQDTSQLTNNQKGHRQIYKAAAEQLLRELQDFLEQEALIVQHLPDYYGSVNARAYRAEANGERGYYLDKYHPRVNAIVEFIHNELGVADKAYQAITTQSLYNEATSQSEAEDPIRKRMAWIARHIRSL